MFPFQVSPLVDKVIVIPQICGISLLSVGIMLKIANAINIDLYSV